jgi:hypothetical protein
MVKYITNYPELLKDPRWQRKRLEIFQRDNFTCQICLAADKTLHVHHIKYVGRYPWETPDKYLLTLCEFCHGQEEAAKELNLLDLWAEAGFTRLELFDIMISLEFTLEVRLPPTKGRQQREAMKNLIRFLIPEQKDFNDWAAGRKEVTNA